MHYLLFTIVVSFFVSCFARETSSNIFSADGNSHTKIETNSEDPQNEKQRGVHVFGRMDSNAMAPLIRSNFEWVTFVPYAGMKDYNSSSIRIFRGDADRRRRRDSMWRSNVKLVHSHGLKVFLKPHIWIGEATDGKWRSDIYPETEEDWINWSADYREFIMHYAEIAELTDVDMFCVGTELTALTLKKPQFWEDLIRDVKKVYSGQLTYAANWYKEYDGITFWDQLDYIGIQAYFPLSKNENATVSDISNGWQSHLHKIEAVHKRFDKKILFTEMGYKSTNDSAIKPWEWMDYSKANQEKLSVQTQANCYQAFFDSVWNQDWFAGVHIWQWRSHYDKSGGEDDTDFTPQRKLAESVIAEGFAH